MGIEFSSSSMVVDQLDVKSVVRFKAENNSPIGPDKSRTKILSSRLSAGEADTAGGPDLAELLRNQGP
jgi:hypothetical protein